MKVILKIAIIMEKEYYIINKERKSMKDILQMENIMEKEL